MELMKDELVALVNLLLKKMMMMMNADESSRHSCSSSRIRDIPATLP